MRTPMTIALLRPPGTTDAGTLVQEDVWLVDVKLTLSKADPEPELFDL